ncbi:hypothetical protein JJB99_23970 [Bradyrhizobium diazoefficiens]|uniref:hypothetical protein n=1 Tax=Bradyrhizobium diazoefficiens TaxID=1355477 RepID=UPI00190A423F|nr:hypothetical protein [Bradyrhizobium diazoefficiens]QQO18395.1 hypothetical protein JJB99_23970 [Bradyrhizobium diazoefficiens]
MSEIDDVAQSVDQCQTAGEHDQERGERQGIGDEKRDQSEASGRWATPSRMHAARAEGARFSSRNLASLCAMSNRTGTVVIYVSLRRHPKTGTLLYYILAFHANDVLLHYLPFLQCIDDLSQHNTDR